STRAPACSSSPAASRSSRACCGPGCAGCSTPLGRGNRWATTPGGRGCTTARSSAASPTPSAAFADAGASPCAVRSRRGPQGHTIVRVRGEPGGSGARSGDRGGGPGGERRRVDEARVDVVRAGDRRARQGGGGAPVRDRQGEPLGRPQPALRGEEVAEQAGVPGAHGADDGGRRGGGVPRTVGGDEDGTGAPERDEYGPHPAVDEGAGRPRGGARVPLEGDRVGPDDRRELLAVRLH